MSPRFWLGCGLLGAFLLPWVGPALEGEVGSFVFWQLRVPRTLLGVLVGAALALCGAAFQVVLENPLASPSTLGTSAGASLGALLVLVGLPGADLGWVALGAFVGATSVSLGLLLAAARSEWPAESILLAGVGLSLAAGAVTTGVLLQADAAATVASVRWGVGSLATVGMGKPALAALPLALGALLVLGRLRALQALALGVERAQMVGVPTRRVRVEVLAGGSLLVAVTVALAGPIGFVGLMVPHLVRRGGYTAPRELLPASALAGAAFLPACDALGRVLFPGRDLPVGVVTAALGVPALLLLLRRPGGGS